MNKTVFIQLLQRYLADKVSAEEAEQLLSGLPAAENEPEWLEAIESILRDNSFHGLSDPHTMREVLAAILADKRAIEGSVDSAGVPPLSASSGTVNFDQFQTRRTYKKVWYAAAAVLVIAISTAVVVSLINNRKVEQTFANGNKRSQNDILPGGNRAVLILAGGQKIILDSAANGTLAMQGNASVQKLSNGQLTYKTLNGKPGAIVYNTLSTPKGGQFKVKLPDGTDVWLNSASSITYPTAFNGKQRNVVISGEAYFEVAKDKAKPFHVKVDDMEVQVLGTHFNINAYEDESSVKTTLLEGSVRVTKNITAVAASSDRQPKANGIAGQPSQSVTLTPGQQAQVEQQHQIKVVNHADVDQVMAWKNGLFNFEGADLKTVMQQLARWYDIDVKYEGDVSKQSFHGEITRDLNLSQVLKLLQDVEVKFRIDGKTLIVTQ
jgi:transmembrane sensor